MTFPACCLGYDDKGRMTFPACCWISDDKTKALVSQGFFVGYGLRTQALAVAAIFLRSITLILSMRRLSISVTSKVKRP